MQDQTHPNPDIMTGYFDSVLSVFNEHDHPFVLVGVWGMGWNGVRRVRRDTIEAVVSAEKMRPFAKALIDTGSWVASLPANPCPYTGKADSPCDDELWLKHARDKGFGPPCYEPSTGILKYLRFYTEARYGLALPPASRLGIDLLEAPDLCARYEACLEEEYMRDPHDRFGPITWESAKVESLEWAADQAADDKMVKDPEHCLTLYDVRARSSGNTTPILVPSVAAHLNALCTRARTGAINVGSADGRGTDSHLYKSVGELYLDWKPTTRWFLDNKIAEENRKTMNEYIGSYQRDRDSCLKDDILHTFEPGKVHWELTVPPEGQKFSECDERCGFCKHRGEEELEEERKEKEERERRDAEVAAMFRLSDESLCDEEITRITFIALAYDKQLQPLAAEFNRLLKYWDYSD